MSKRLVTIILFLIILSGALLRFYHISNNPPGLNSDEVAIGYNAYSILKTGRDEYGQKFPLAFRSFDDYKPPLYIYLTVPSVAVFGLTEFAVRFPSALLGVLAIIVTYFLTKELLGNSATGLLASFLLAISPWHIQYTRTGYETGSQAFFGALGLFLLLKAKVRFRYLVLSALVFGIETYLYQASRIFVPLLVLCAVLILHWPNLKKILVYGAIFSFVFLPNIFVMLSPNGLIRFQGTSLFQDIKPQDQLLAIRRTDWFKNDNKSVLLFHPGIEAYFQPVLNAYLSHFRPDFLVGSDTNNKVAYALGVGLLHLWELPLLLAGCYFLAKKKSKITALLFVWLLLVPIPAAVTQNTPSSVRTAAFLPILQIISALGIYEIFKSNWRKVLTSVFIIVFLYEFSFYLHMLFVHAPIVFAKTWYQGYNRAVIETNILAPKYDRVLVSTGLDEPQIFYLFYLRYDPSHYQTVDGGTVSGGFAEDRNHFSKYIFKPINWPTARYLPKTLLVGLASEFPQDAHVIKTFTYLDGTPSIAFVDEQK